MPQASDELRMTMFRYFGDEIDDNGPLIFLESRGYILRKGWLWEKPVSAHTINDEEYNCLQFLIEEWDFGGIVA